MAVMTKKEVMVTAVTPTPTNTDIKEGGPADGWPAGGSLRTDMKGSSSSSEGLHERLPLTGQSAVDKLNTEVVRKIERAVATAKLPGTPPIPFVLAQTLKPMSWDGMWAGAPIYVTRSKGQFWFNTCIGGLMGCFGISQVGLATAILCAFASFVSYDLYSGILHVVLDNPKTITLPFIGQPALEFQWHHFIPSDIVRKDFADVLGDLNMTATLLMCIHTIYSTQWLTAPIATTLAGMKLMWAYYGQFSHRSAHNPRIKMTRWPKLLQDAGMMISVIDHKQHHAPPHDEDFCLIGWCNPIIDGMLLVCTNCYAWLALFLAYSVFDIVLTEQVVTTVLQQLDSAGTIRTFGLDVSVVHPMLPTV